MNKNGSYTLMDNRLLINKVGKTLQKIGPVKFFSDPDQEIQKDREGFAEFFLCQHTKNC